MRSIVLYTPFPGNNKASNWEFRVGLIDDESYINLNKPEDWWRNEVNRNPIIMYKVFRYSIPFSTLLNKTEAKNAAIELAKELRRENDITHPVYHLQTNRSWKFIEKFAENILEKRNKSYVYMIEGLI